MSGSFCSSATSFSSMCDNLHVNGPALFSVNELCGVCVGVNNGVDGNFGGDEAGVLNIVVVVIFSKNPSNCLRLNALWRVSSGLIGGTPPKPSQTKIVDFNQYLILFRARIILFLFWKEKKNHRKNCVWLRYVCNIWMYASIWNEPILSVGLINEVNTLIWIRNVFAIQKNILVLCVFFSMMKINLIIFIFNMDDSTNKR